MRQKRKCTEFFIKGSGLPSGLSSEVRTDRLKDIGLQRGVRLRFIREMLGMSIENFSKALEVNIGALGRFERGKTVLSIVHACWIKTKLLELGIDVKTVWLLNGKRKGPEKIQDNSKEMNSFFSSIVGKNLDDEELDEYDKATIEIHTFKKVNGDKAIISYARDTNMLPVISKGDYVGAIKSDIYDVNGQDCIIVCKKTGARLLRKVFKHDEKSVILTTYNNNILPEVTLIEDIEQIGIIVWVRKNLSSNDMELSIL